MSPIRSTGSNPQLARLAEIGRTPLATVPRRSSRPRPSEYLEHVASLHQADDCTGWVSRQQGRKLEYEWIGAAAGRLDLGPAGGPLPLPAPRPAAPAGTLSLASTANGTRERQRPPHRLLGARIVTVENREDRVPAIEEEAGRIVAAGGKALAVPLGASTARGAFGYVHAVAEMRDQVGRDGVPPWIFVSSSSGGTLAGLILGCAIFDWSARVVAVSADEPADRIGETAWGLAAEAARLLVAAADPAVEKRAGDDIRGSETGLVDRVRDVAAGVWVTDDFVGAGYGIATPAGGEASRIFGARAGVILDPVYTAKAAAAMIAWLRDGRVGAGGRAVFLHTGGHPALFR